MRPSIFSRTGRIKTVSECEGGIKEICTGLHNYSHRPSSVSYYEPLELEKRSKVRGHLVLVSKCVLNRIYHMTSRLGVK